MTDHRAFFTLSELADGTLLAAGGLDYSTGTVFDTSKTFDPTTGTGATVGNMMTPRYQQAAMLLPTGEVLVAGGYNLKFQPSGLCRAVCRVERWRGSD